METMKQPIGVLLADTENREAYNLLSDNYDDVIPYIGTGLSMFFGSWGAPFESILDDLKKHPVFDTNGKIIHLENTNCFFVTLSQEEKVRAQNAVLSLNEASPFTSGTCLRDYLRYAVDSMNRYFDEDSKLKIRFPKNGNVVESQRIWKIFDKLYNQCRFLELGELINLVSLTISGDSFNQRFFRTIKNKTPDALAKKESDIDIIGHLNALDNKKSLPPARWFLPFFGKKARIAFTTNTDATMEWIYEETLNNSPVPYSANHTPDEIKRTAKGRGNARVVYHIHGFQPDGTTDTANTFIMTWSDYRKKYSDGSGSPLIMLIDFFRNNFFFFIGASLDKDTTVELMKRTTQMVSATDKHVVIFKYPDGKLDSQSFQNKLIGLKQNMATRAIIISEFDYYSIVLCHLVREKNMHEWAVFKSILNTTEIGEAQFTRNINSFLKKDDSYLEYQSEIHESELDSKLYPALKTVLSHNGKRVFNWSVCFIDSEDFCFPIRTISKSFDISTYSAPLGNTIYLVGGAKMTSTKQNSIICDIKKWTENHEVDYWIDPVKVRVIRVSVTGDFSIDKLKDKLAEIKNLSEIDAIAEFLQLIPILSSITTYDAFHLQRWFLMKSLTGENIYTIINLLLSQLESEELFNRYLSQIEAERTHGKKLVLKPSV